MKAARRRHASRTGTSGELADLRVRLAEAEHTLGAIRAGEVDAVVVAGGRGVRVFTLGGAERAYRVLIESMNEGALSLASNETILYANKRFASMVQRPLERVIGSSIGLFLAAEGRKALRPLLKRTGNSAAQIRLRLSASDGSQVPAQLSVRRLSKKDSDGAAFVVVVTDMTKARRDEAALRALSRRVVQVQEAERGRVSRELHDHITQLLCAILFRFQALAGKLSARDEPSRVETTRLGEMLGEAAEEVERISRNMRPGVLDELGLVKALHAVGVRFADRTGVRVKLVCVKLTARLAADTELSLYRIFQESLENVERHARARHVDVRLDLRGSFVRLAIRDDGIGFHPDHQAAARKAKGGVGLISMRERATYVGGTLEVKSIRRGGTEIEVRVPLSPSAAAAD